VSNLREEVSKLVDCWLMFMVHAAVLKSPRLMEIKEFKKDVPPGSVLLRVDAAGVCGTDQHIYNGTLTTARYPLIIGHEVSGTIEAMGRDCAVKSFDKLKIGDRVALTPGITCGKCYYCKTFPHMENYCIDRKTLGSNVSCNKPPYLLGGFGEYMVIPAGFWLHKLPDGISSEEGAIAEPLAVAIRAVGRLSSPGLPYAQMGLGIGSGVVVQGAGAIGLLVSVCAMLSGADVTILDKIPFRLTMAKKFGIKKTINVSKLTDTELVAEVKEGYNGVGPDAVVEASGELNAVLPGLEMVRKGGRYVELGHFADVGEVKIKPSFICRNDLEFVGSVLGSPQDYRKVMYLLSHSSLPFKSMVTHRFALEEAESAILNAKAHKGLKTMVFPNGD